MTSLGAARGSAPGPRWGLRPPRSSQRSLRVATKAASFNSLAHWASASLLPPLAALGSAPLPLLKKRGKTSWKASSVFRRNGLARRLSEAAGLIRRPGSGAGRAAGRSLRRRKFQRSGGGGGVWRPGGPWAPGPAKQKSGGRGQRPRPRAFRTLRVLPPPPRAAGISINAKGQRKNPAFRPTLPRSVLHPEKAGSDPLSRATAPGQPRPPGRDYRRGRSTGVVFSHI